MSLRVSMSSWFISACSGLMYSSVPTKLPNWCEHRPLRELLAGRLGDAEVDDLGHRHAVVEADQDVGGLQVAVDDALLVGVLHRVADRNEELQPLLGRSGGARRRYWVMGTPWTSSITK